MKRVTKFLILLLLVVALFLTVGCGQSATDYISKNFPLEDVQGNEKDGLQRIYRAENMTVAQVVDKITGQQEPQEKSVKDDKAVLVYDKNIITVKKDDQKAQDSLIFESSYQFVKNNTDYGFWEGYLTARILDHIFGSVGYRGPPYTYTGGGQYKGPWDYTGDAKGDAGSGIKKPGSISKPTTSVGTGEAIRKSSGQSTDDHVISDNNWVGKISSKSSGSIFSKPKTSSGFGKVIRKSRRF